MLFRYCRPSTSTASGIAASTLYLRLCRLGRFSSSDAANHSESPSSSRMQRQHAEWANLGDGKRWEFRSGLMARMATASVVLSTEEQENAILGTVVSKYTEQPLVAKELLEDAEEAQESMPKMEDTDEATRRPKESSKSRAQPQLQGLALSIDFRQSASAIGRIPSNYFRRELSHNEQSIAISRAIDRTLRPTIQQNFPGKIHLVCKPLALDAATGDSTILGINVASASLACSPVPLRCTVAAARVGIVDGQIVVNPVRDQLKHSTLNLVMSGTSQLDDIDQTAGEDPRRVLMIEMEGREVDSDKFVDCVRLGFEAIQETESAIRRLVNAVGSRKYEFMDPELENSAYAELNEHCEVCQNAVEAILTDYSHDKQSRDEAMKEVFEGWRLLMSRQAPQYGEQQLRAVFTQLVKRVHRQLVLDTGRRIDGRALDEFRPIECRVDLYKNLHGSALFQRGQSQVLSTVTFDSPQAAFHPDAVAQLLGAQRKKTFMLHYEFPQFAVNEIEGGSSRREVGHGLLAEKAIRQVMPDEFPYTVRLACQVLESNGSTSMASVCAGSLALYDAGVTLKANHVAGLALGLLTDGEGKNANYTLLTDLMGFEDFAGDMDFKIAGTQRGFTAMQMDLKICGLPFRILREALQRAETGLEHVLTLMRETIAEPRSEFKPSVPIIELMPMPQYNRTILFRSAGYNAKLIEAETGVTVTSEDDTNISLFAPNKECLEQAKALIKKLLEEQQEENYQFGAIYKAEIVQIMEGGVMVALREGARPIWMRNSDLSVYGRKNAMALGLQVGSRLNVQYFGRDQHSGMHRISCKTLQIMDPPVQNLFGRDKPGTSSSNKKIDTEESKGCR